MKKIIFLFLMFSAIVFAKWEVGTLHTTSGDPLIYFSNYDFENEASINIGVNIDYDYSAVFIYNSQIKKGDNSVALIITDNEGNDMQCNFYEDDIYDDCINIPSGRSTVLTKMLYNGKSAVLKNIYIDETLAKFDLKGIKKVMQKHVGNSYWYKYKLND